MLVALRLTRTHSGFDAGRLLCAIVLLASAGCTSANPDYAGPSRRDGAGPVDGSGVDAPVADLALPSDCTRDEDCTDGRDCTRDRCVLPAGRCRFEVLPDTCLIDEVCYVSGQADPGQGCRYCDPASPAQWTAKPEEADCPDDGLDCTADVCRAGQCAHELEGPWCLLDGTCVAEGSSNPSDPCWACAPQLSTSAPSFVAGKPCVAATGAGGMCVQGSCRGWQEQDPGVAVTELQSSSLAAVTHVPTSGAVWAVGEFTQFSNEPKGVIVRLTPAVVPQLPQPTERPMRNIHHRLAVGAQGLFYHYAGGWTRALKLESLVEADRFGVWGTATQVSGERYLLSGLQTPETVPGIFECSLVLTTWSCEAAYDELGDRQLLGAVVSAPKSASGPGGAWAAVFGDWEDIYYRPQGVDTWVLNSPYACFDADTPQGTQTACDGTVGTDLLDLFASADTDIWAVGTGGLILRFDGSKWQRLQQQFAHQNDYDLTAVFSDQAEGLTTVVGARGSGGNRQPVIFNRNGALGRWFGPIAFADNTVGSDAQIRDLGGNGYGELWLVGHQPTGEARRQTAWALVLE